MGRTEESTSDATHRCSGKIVCDRPTAILDTPTTAQNMPTTFPEAAKEIDAEDAENPEDADEDGIAFPVGTRV